jgi:hypothetical protein
MKYLQQTSPLLPEKYGSLSGLTKSTEAQTFTGLFLGSFTSRLGDTSRRKVRIESCQEILDENTASFIFYPSTITQGIFHIDLEKK